MTVTNARGQSVRRGNISFARRLAGGRTGDGYARFCAGLNSCWTPRRQSLSAAGPGTRRTIYRLSEGDYAVTVTNGCGEVVDETSHRLQPVL